MNVSTNWWIHRNDVPPSWWSYDNIIEDGGVQCEFGGSLRIPGGVHSESGGGCWEVAGVECRISGVHFEFGGVCWVLVEFFFILVVFFEVGGVISQVEIISSWVDEFIHC